MWVDDTVNTIETEFPFIKFNKGKYNNKPSYHYDSELVYIYIILDIIKVIDNRNNMTFNIKEGTDVITALYKVLPKDFYLAHQRNNKIDIIID